MPLIRNHRQSPADLEHWATMEMFDRRLGRDPRLDRKADDAARVLLAFRDAGGPGYVGVSWGKDSVVVADIACRAGMGWPLVWVRMKGVENPDCPLVRDAFLALHPGATYDEIEVDYDPAARRTSAPGFEVAAARHGDRYASGVRAEEAGYRKLRMRHHGLATARTCAPIGWWSGVEIFAYLERHALPVHPAYGCTMGGTYDRIRVRVGAIGGERGTMFGRREWEQRYYPDALGSR